MRTIIAVPPLPRMSGGLAVLYQLAARLRELGREVALTSTDNTPGFATKAAEGFTLIPWETVAGRNTLASPFLRPDDTFLISEGWPNMMAPALAAKARVLVYAQSWIYIFSSLPQGTSWDHLPVTFLAVSHPVANFLKEMAGLPVTGILRPSVDHARFHPQSAPGKTVRIAWMPRKNKALAEQIMQISQGLDRGGKPRVEWVEIRNMAPDDVAKTLASCHIFLATGFPEGCPLPPLEAMGSGCLVVGFSGFGGWDYMRQALPGAYLPQLPFRPVPWAGNGLFASDGDVLEASRLLVKAVDMVRQDDAQYHAIREQALLTAAAYSAADQREAVGTIWNGLENRNS